jgi:uncharacterized protein YmfQ (DUF2313 family)
MPAQSTIDRARNALLGLLPQRLFRRELDSPIVKLVSALAVEFARIQERLGDLRGEVLPSQTEELLDEWEETLGLTASGTDDDRRAVIGAKLLDSAGHAKPDLIEMATALGHEHIQFARYQPFYAGSGRAGDALTNDWWSHVVHVNFVSVDRDAALESQFERVRRAHATFEYDPLDLNDWRARDWVHVDPGTTEDLYGTTRTTLHTIAVGNSGKILRSPDGFTWTSDPTGITANLRGIAWNGLAYGPSICFVVVGAGGKIYTGTSPGGPWTLRTSGTIEDLTGAAWTGSLFVVFGANNTILTSPDGITWTPRSVSAGATFGFSGVAFDGVGTVIAAGYGSDVAISTNGGVTWSANAHGLTGTIIGLCWDATNSQFVGVGFDGGPNTLIATSPDGIVWTPRPGGAVIGLLTSVAEGEGVLVAAGWAGGLLSSGDAGVTWSSRTVPTDQNLNSVVWMPAATIAPHDGFVVVGASGVAFSSART